MTVQTLAETQSFDAPVEVRTFDKGRLDLITVAGGLIGRLVLQPGWRWSEHVKPIAGTDLCEAPHFQYHLAGRIGVRMEDGRQFEIGPGEVSYLASGHDAWVVGDEQVVLIDWHGASHYAQRPTEPTS